MISILIAACISLSAGDPPTQKEQLEFLAATQEQTQSAYARLSYDGVMTSTSFVPELNRPFTQTTNYEVRIRSGTKLVTTIYNNSLIKDQEEPGEKSEGGNVTISDKPNVIKVLRTPNYLVLWGIVEIPSVKVYFREDWKNELERYDKSFSTFDSLVDISQLCFGDTEPFAISYRRPIHWGGPWGIVSFDADGDIRVQREMPNRDGISKLESDYTFYAEDGLMKASRFEPNLPKAKQSKASLSTRQIEYTLADIGAEKIRIPTRYLADGGIVSMPETKYDNTIEFSNFSDESALPAFTLRNMGVPEGVSIKRGFPDERIERIDWDRFVELSNEKGEDR
jgi:hypothetical protein